MNRLIVALCAIAFFAFASLGTASAQYGAGVGTGGTMALRQGVPHAQTVYEDQCRRIGAYNHPMCMTGQRRGHGHGVQGRRVIPVFATGAHYDRRVAAGHYGRTAVVRPVAPPPPPPSAQQIYSAVPHKTVSVCAPCDQTRGWNYIQDPETCQCDAARWRPGPPPR